jgi:aryl-alcohol dehydrogenase-like predicted oxidoreductase
MEYRVLGKNGVSIPVIGLGAWPIGGGMGHVDKENAIALIHAAIDNGITLIDTAQAYRTSESVVGKALKNGYRIAAACHPSQRQCRGRLFWRRFSADKQPARLDADKSLRIITGTLTRLKKAWNNGAAKAEVRVQVF